MSESLNILSTLKPEAMRELMRLIMEAHYRDAMAAKCWDGTGPSPSNENAMNLSVSLGGLVDAVGHAMDTGELTPFHGDYTDWLVAHGYMRGKMTGNVIENIAREQRKVINGEA